MADNLRTVTGTGPYVKTSDNAGVHTPHGIVDQVPSDPFGANADAAVESDSDGSISGKLRGLVKLFSTRVATLGQKNKAGSAPVVLASDHGNVPVLLRDHVDAFSRVRVSNPYTMFDSQHQYDTSSQIWDESIVGGSSSVAHLPNESSVRLRAGTAGGDKVIRQTRRYIRYQPGKSCLVFNTFVMGAPTANVERRVGYFDSQNGVFLEQTSAGFSLKIRTYTSGSIQHEVAAQADWNIDKLDGTGASGFSLDPTMVQILVFDLQWLGAGRVRAGFDINGDVIWCHQFFHANLISSVYMTTANLPLRYEIENTGITGTTNDFIQICSSVISEGGFEENRGFSFTAGNGVASIGVSTRRPIFSIRPALLFNGVVNRSYINPLKMVLAAKTNAAYVEIVRGGTLTGASFSSVDASSAAERDSSANAIAGGRVLYSFYVPAASDFQVNEFDIPIDFPLVLNDIAGSIQPALSVVVTSMAATSNITAAINWEEVR